MASKLYFHGHPINRREAKEELRLQVNLDLSPELEATMWDLYREYEAEFENLAMFNPAANLAAEVATGATPSQAPVQKEYTLVHAIVESARLSSKHTTRRRYTAMQLGMPGQAAIREDVLAQGWSHSLAPTGG